VKTILKTSTLIKDLFVSFLLISAYFITRLINIKILPIFTDEAIYSFWAQVALHDPENRYISLVDGKQPLFIWFAAISQHIIKDPLVATRLVSVFAGFGALIGIYILAFKLFNKKTAIISAILYITIPFTLFYDRLALFDSLLTMIGIYVVLLSVKMAKNPSLDIALLNGISIGLGQITKSSANFFLYLLPFSLLLFSLKDGYQKIRILKWFLLSGVTFILSFLIYNSLRLSPLFYIIAQKNLEFIRPISTVIKNPFEYFQSNFYSIINWLVIYISIPLFLLFLLGAIYGLLKRNLKILYLIILILGPFMAENVFNKVLYPRFILFYFPYIIIIIAYTVAIALDKFPKYKYYLIALFIIILLVPANNSFWLITNPLKAKLPDAEAIQYRDDWPAGYGVEEVKNIIIKESQSQDVYIGTEGTFGLYPFALNIYFYGNEKVHIYSYWPVNVENLPQQVIDFSKNHKTYFIYNFSQKPIIDKHAKLVAKFQKGNGNSYMRLYEVMP